MKTFKILFLGTILFILHSTLCFSQFDDEGEKYHYPNVSGISPQVYQFIKYGEIPVNEYNGVPNISIPLYTIDERGFSFPITLSYNASGIRVSEEASWVGLGWDIQLGSIIQRVNGWNDFLANFGGGSVYGEMDIPDYVKGPPVPYYQLFNESALVNGTDPDGEYSHWIYDGNYLPKNEVMVNMENLLDGYKDSEPDIMQANFLGHSLQFMQDPKTGNLVILNEKGYKISKTVLAYGIGWVITSPDGVVFKFEEFIEIRTASNTDPIQPGQNMQGVDLSTCQTASTPTPSTSCSGIGNSLRSPVIWKLSEINTPNGGKITFNYRNEMYKTVDYSYDGRWNVMEATNQGNPGTCISGVGETDGPFDYIGNQFRRPYANDVGVPYEFQTYSEFSNATCTSSRILESISYSSGIVNFSVSEDRSDYLGSEKLNQIEILNLDDEIIKSIQFNYDYFTTTYASVGKCVVLKTSDELTKRLKLVSVVESGMPPFQFHYDETNLPPKNSYATDYWGYYNGKDNNISNLPNILRIVDESNLAYPQLADVLANNTSNHSASLEFNKACVLDEITYPTGGKTTFDYELNQFDNYILPDQEDLDYDPTQSMTNGFGLRISTTTNTDENKFITRKSYGYEGGKSILPIKLYLEDADYVIYLDNVWNEGSASPQDEVNYKTIFISGSNFYVPGSLSGGNYVGYDKVTIRNLDSIGNSLGRIERYYQNQPFKTPLITDYRITAPAIATGLENGLTLVEKIYDNNGLIQQTDNIYEFVMNAGYYYGVKLAFLGAYGTNYDPGFGTCDYGAYRKTKAAYYPIFSHYSRLTDTNTTNLYEDNRELSSSKTFYYNSYNFIESVRIDDSTPNNGDIWTQNYYPFQSNLITELSVEEKSIIDELVNKNILTPVILKRKTFNGVAEQQLTTYQKIQDHLLPKEIRELYGYTGEWKTLVTYDSFDDKANINNFTQIDQIPISYQWAYNSTLPVVEIVNAKNDYHEETEVTEGFETIGFTVGGLSGVSTTKSFTVDYPGTVTLSGGVPGNSSFTVYMQYEGIGGGGSFPLTINQGCDGASGSFSVAPGDYVVTLTFNAPDANGSSFGACGSIEYPAYLENTTVSGIKEFYYQGFEEEDASGVTIIHDETQAHTGEQYYDGTSLSTYYSASFTMPNSRDYVIEYWYHDGGNWQRVVKPYTGTSMELDDSYIIDDVRIYPDDARMTTYTYKPLVGMTSQLDPNGKRTLYEYDEFGRLKNVRDDEKLYIQHHEYQYK